MKRKSEHGHSRACPYKPLRCYPPLISLRDTLPPSYPSGTPGTSSQGDAHLHCTERSAVQVSRSAPTMSTRGGSTPPRPGLGLENRPPCRGKRETNIFILYSRVSSLYTLPIATGGDKFVFVVEERMPYPLRGRHLFQEYSIFKHTKKRQGKYCGLPVPESILELMCY